MSYQLNPSVDILTGTATLTSAPTLLIPFTDLIARTHSFSLWVASARTNGKRIEVQFERSPNGDIPDRETLPVKYADPGQAAVLQRDKELMRFWAILARCPTWIMGDTVTVNYGITIARD